jgi:hypothetical protein
VGRRGLRGALMASRHRRAYGSANGGGARDESLVVLAISKARTHHQSAGGTRPTVFLLGSREPVRPPLDGLSCRLCERLYQKSTFVKNRFTGVFTRGAYRGSSRKGDA